MMNKEQVFKELKEYWNYFNMTPLEIERAYLTITGLRKAEDQTTEDLKNYLLDYILEQMIDDNSISIELANEIKKDIAKLQ